jgi:hypothetical protein
MKEHMHKDEQLLPIGIGTKITAVLEQLISKTLEPIYSAFEKAVAEINKAASAEKRDALVDVEAFDGLVAKMADALVDGQYFDASGMKIPKAISAQFDAIDTAKQEKIAKLREAMVVEEAKVNAWRKAVQVDLELCLTIPDQRIVLAKVLESNPLEGYAMEATIAATTEG